jgi:hypothetical protein
MPLPPAPVGSPLRLLFLFTVSFAECSKWEVLNIIKESLLFISSEELFETTQS